MTETNDWWLAGATYTMSVTYTQGNAAGGAVVCDISPGTGNEFILLEVRAANSGTNGIDVRTVTGPTGTVFGSHILIGSGAGTEVAAGVGTVSTTVTTTKGPSGIGFPCVISGAQDLRIAQTAAGAQNDTFQVLVNIRIKTSGMPTVIHSNSTNPANVTVTAGAESFTAV